MDKVEKLQLIRRLISYAEGVKLTMNRFGAAQMTTQVTKDIELAEELFKEVEGYETTTNM